MAASLGQGDVQGGRSMRQPVATDANWAGLLDDLESFCDEIEPGEIPDALGRIERCRAALWTRMLTAGQAAKGTDREPDRLLTAEEAAEVMRVSPDYLYRHADELPFTVRPTPGTLRFSERGIARYLRARQGSR